MAPNSKGKGANIKATKGFQNPTSTKVAVNNIIINNNISNNNGDGFILSGDENIICGNNFYDNEGYCIIIPLPDEPWPWGWSTTYNIIYQNNFVNNTAYHKFPDSHKWDHKV